MTTLVVPRRTFLIGAIASLFAAPAIVRATSLMPIRTPALMLDPVALTLDAAGTSADYTYWVSMGGHICRMTAAEILRAPAGAIQPWLPEHFADGSSAFRATDSHRVGLRFFASPSQHDDAPMRLEVRDLGGKLDRDPVIARLRAEHDALLRQRRALIAQQKAAKRTAAYVAANEEDA